VPPRPVVATPWDGRWLVVAPEGRTAFARTLRQLQETAEKLTERPMPVHVDLAGWQDMAADAVDLGAQADAAYIAALKLERRAARALAERRIGVNDVGVILHVPEHRARHLLESPVESAWMTTGQSPWRELPREQPEADSTNEPASTRTIYVVAATPDDGRWIVDLPDQPNVTAATLAHAAGVARRVLEEAATDIEICPYLGSTEALVEQTLVAGLHAGRLHQQAYGLRLKIARHLRSLGVGYRDIGDLLGIHHHRVRLLLGHAP